MKFPWQKRWKPVSVLTGFLGSGKTTILQHLLALPEMHGTAIIINEFGEISVDHLLLETAEEKMVLLSNGCVCCSVRGDLVQAIRSLFQRMRSDQIPPFERILLETTGLADPGPIVQSLIGPALSNLPVYFDSIATTIDSTNIMEALEQHKQIHSQIAVADSLLFTKADLCEKVHLDNVENRIRKLNPRATRDFTEMGKIPSRRIFGQRLLDPSASPKQARSTTEQMFSNTEQSVEHSHGDDIRSFVISRDKPLPYSTLDTFLQTLRSYRGQDLLRVKGLVQIQGSENRPVVIHGVQSVMHSPITLKKWPSSDHRTKLVFVTRNIGYEDVENTLAGIERSFR